MEENNKIDEAIKYIQNSYCDTHIGYPYMLLGDVAQLIKILTDKELNLNYLITYSNNNK